MLYQNAAGEVADHYLHNDSVSEISYLIKSFPEVYPASVKLIEYLEEAFGKEDAMDVFFEVTFSELYEPQAA